MKALLSDMMADLSELGGKRSLRGLILRYWADPSFATICRWRLSIYWRKRGFHGRILSKALWKRNIRNSGCFLSPTAVIGPGIVFPHASAIVVGEGTVIGERVTIYQNVTLGVRSHKVAGYPIVEDGVRIFAGACVVGAVRLRRGSIVGANAVVTRDVAPGLVVGGVPAKPLRVALQDKDHDFE